MRPGLVRAALPLWGLALLGAGCTSPRALSPAIQTPLQRAWEDQPQGSVAVGVGTAAWWQVFHDDVLDRLMRLGVERSLDLKLAQARIAQARAQHQATTAALFPDVNLSASDSFQHNPTQPSFVPKLTLQAALEASWNVDLFGTLRNQRRAAIAAEQAAQYDRDATELRLLAQVATAYLEYRLYQLEYAIATRNATSQQETVRITRLRFEQGAASRLDVEQLVSELAITRAAVPQALEQAQSARAELVLLLASTPEELATDLPAAVPDDPKLPGADPLTVLQTPAQVIAQRPDIRSAEQQLRSAAASLAAAKAQRYPQISLAALFGQDAADWAAFPKSSSRAWSYSESLLAPVFDFGRIRAAIDAADATQQQAYLNFEQTVRTALQSTQTAISLYTEGAQRERELRTALDSARIAAELARRQYQEGALALLNVLDAERTAYATELTWAEAAAAVAVRLVNVYQTLGAAPPPLAAFPAG